MESCEMFRCKAFVVVLAIFVGSRLSAQTTARPTDPVFVRAQAMVSDGNGVAGGAPIDSMISATPPSTPFYPQALFFPGNPAAGAAHAEGGCHKNILRYPLAPPAPPPPL